MTVLGISLSALIRESRERVDAWLAILLLSIAIPFGGGGTLHPLSELVVMLGAAMIFWLHLLLGDVSRPRPGWLIAIMALIVAVPVLQLIPLPPNVWQSLPGRDLDAAILTAADVDWGWRPISLVPGRTLYVLFSLMPMLVAIWLLGGMREQANMHRVGWAVVLWGVVSAITAAMQIAAAVPENFYPYGAGGQSASGFFANRNHFGSFIAVALAFLGWLHFSSAKAEPKWTAILGALAALLTLAGIASLSRTGGLLIAMVLCLIALLTLTKLKGWQLLGALAGIPVLLAGVHMLSRMGVIAQLLGRFDDMEDMRPLIWERAYGIAQEYFPWGSGLGGFRVVYDPQEPVQEMLRAYVNSAHQDYIDLAINAGLPGIAALVLCTALLVYHIAHAKMERMDAILLLPIAVWALHSLVDYPLHTIAHEVLLGVTIVLASKYAKGNDQKFVSQSMDYLQ